MRLFLAGMFDEAGHLFSAIATKLYWYKWEAGRNMGFPMSDKPKFWKGVSLLIHRHVQN